MTAVAAAAAFASAAPVLGSADIPHSDRAPRYVAAPPVLGVSITMTTDANFIDADNCTSSSPNAAYVGYRITNTSGATLTNLRATLSGVSGGFALLASQNPQIYVGTLASGESRYVYYLLSSPCSSTAVANLVMTVTSATDSKAVTTPVRGAGAVAAQAGGAVGATVLGPGAIVGQTVFLDATYTFGNVKAGDTYNLQPVGNTDFAANCLVLTSMVVTASAVPSIPVGTTDQLYYIATADQGGNSNPVSVRWYFKYMCAGVASTARPYAVSTSGQKLKYSGNYDGGGAQSQTFPGASNPFAGSGATTLTVTPTLMSTGGTVTYTLTVNNSSAYDATLDSLAVVLPAGVTYGAIAAGSGVNSANSDEMPTAGATGRIVFRGIPNTTYYVGPNGSLVLKFTATVQSVQKAYVASGFAYAGSTSMSGGTATVTVGADVHTAISGPTSAIVGTNIQYIVSTVNFGPAGATGVVTRMTLPAGLTYVSGSRSGTVSAGLVSFPAVSLALNATLFDTVTVSVTSAGSKTIVGSSVATSSDSLQANNDGSLSGAHIMTNAVALTVTTRSVTTGVVSKLPGSGYTTQFVARNTSSVSASFSISATSAAASGPFLTPTAIAGSGIAVTGTTGTITMNAGDSVFVTVTYNVATGAPANEDLKLTATSTLVPSVTNNALLTIRRTVPQMMVVRGVDIGVPKPGEDVMHTIETQNIGENLASTVQVTDSIGGPMQFKLASVSTIMLGGLTATVEYSTNGTLWTYTPVSGGCGAPSGYDACIRWIRWNIVQQVPVTSGSTRAGVFRYSARVR